MTKMKRVNEGNVSCFLQCFSLSYLQIAHVLELQSDLHMTNFLLVFCDQCNDISATKTLAFPNKESARWATLQPSF